MRNFINANQLTKRLTDVYIGLMLTVFLLWFDKTGYREITHAKLTVFFIFSGIYIVGMLILVAVGRETPKIEKISAVQWFVLAYLLITLLSAMLSPHSQKAWLGATRHEGAFTIAVYCIIFLLVSLYGGAERKLLYPLGIGAAALCVLCIIQLYGGNPFSLYPKDTNFFGSGIDYIGQYLGTVGNTGLLASYFCVVIPIMWVSILRLDGKKRFMQLIPLILSLFVLIKMNVAAGLAGVFFGGALSLPVVIKERTKLRRIIAWTLLALIIIGLAVIYFANSTSGTLREVHEILHGNISDSFGSSRIYIWKNVLNRVPDRFLFGAGPDTLGLENIKPFTRYNEVTGEYITAHIDTAHNEYLNVLYHQGILALGVYLAALVLSAEKWIKRSNDSLTAITGAAVLCYCIQAFFGISMFINAPFFWISLALLNENKNPC